MPNPSLQPIYDRLNQTESYHPFTADTFTDWASEAGDTVVISRKGIQYISPVHKQTLSWHGKQQVSMETGGNREREAVEKLSDRKYRSGGGGALRTTSGKIWQFEANEEHLFYLIEDPTTGLLARMEATESELTTLYQKTGVNSLGQNETLYSLHTQTAEAINDEIVRATGAEGDLQTSITSVERDIEGVRTTVGDIEDTVETIDGTVTSITGSALWTNRNDITGVVGEFAVETDQQGKKRLVVQSGGGMTIKRNNVEYGLYDSGTLTSGVLIRTINGNSNLKLSADVIDVDGLVTELEAKTIGVGGLHVEGQSEFYQHVYLESTLTAEETIRSNTGFSVGGTTLNVADATVNGNVLTITYVDGTTQDFSKATTLTGAWDSGVFTVTASPQNQTKTIRPDIRFEGQGQTSFTVAVYSTAGNTGETPTSQLTKYGYLNLTGTGAGAAVTVSGNQDGTSTVASISVGTLYTTGRTYGQNEVTLSKSWNTSTKVATISKSVGTGASVTVSIDADDVRWGTGANVNKAYVDIYDGDPGGSGVFTGFTAEVNAQGRYNAGFDAVTLTPSWTTALANGDSNTFTVSAQNKTNGTTRSESTTLYVVPVAAWAAGNKRINLRESNSTSGTVRAYVDVDIPDPQDYVANKISNGVYTLSFTVGGKSFTSSQFTTDGSTATGWDTAVGKNLVPERTNTNAYMTVGWPDTTFDTQKTHDYYVEADNSFAYITWTDSNSTKHIVARAAHSAYTNGQTFGQNEVTLNKGQWASGNVSIAKSVGTGSPVAISLDATDPSWNGNTATVAIYDGDPDNGGVNTGFSVTVNAGGRYTEGQNAVTLSTPAWNTVTGSTPSSRTLTVTTLGRPTQLTADKTVYLTVGTWSNGSIPVYIREDTMSGTAVAQNSVSMPAVSATTWTNTTGRTWRADLTIGGVTRSSETKNFDSYYTDGQDSVTITKGSWSGGDISFTKSAGTASTKSVSLDATDPSWNGNTATVAIYDGDPDNGGTNTGFSVTVNAGGRYTAGQNAVTLKDPVWIGSTGTSATATNEVKVETQGRPTNLEKTKKIYLNVGTWSSGSIPVTVTDTTSTGTVVAQNSVSMPAVSSTTWTNTTGRTWRADLTIGGVTRSSTTKDFGGYYTDGQNNVTITKGSWSNGNISFTKSAGTASTKSVSLDAADPVWSGDSATVAIYDGDPDNGGVNTGFSVTVNAGSSYNAGWADYYNSGLWERPSTTNNVIKTPGATPSASAYTWFTITANATSTYNATTHEYDIEGQARAKLGSGGSSFVVATYSTTSGTDAYNAGWLGYNNSGKWQRPRKANSGVCKTPGTTPSADSVEWFTVTTGLSGTWNAGTHCYTFTAKAYDGSSEITSSSHPYYLVESAGWTPVADRTYSTKTVYLSTSGNTSTAAANAVGSKVIYFYKADISVTNLTKVGSTAPSTDATIDSIGITARESAWYTFNVTAGGQTKSVRFSIGTTDIPGGGGSATPGTISRQSTAAGDSFISGARKATTAWTQASSGMYYKFSVSGVTYYFIG